MGQPTGGPGALAVVVVTALTCLAAVVLTTRTSDAAPNSGLPGAPTAVRASAGNASAAVTWTAPGRQGSGITGYLIRTSNGPSIRVGVVTTVVVTGLTNGLSYRFTAAAVVRNGTGPASSRSTAVTPVAPPVAPVPPAPPVPSHSSLLVPLYDSSSADWQRACTTVGQGSSVVADIGSPGGPGLTASSAWATDLGYCATAHVGVLGYVDTGYCQVTVATAESQIDSWYRWYGSSGVDGIFFDEAADPTDPTTATDCLGQTDSAVGYYRTLAAYVHGHAAGQTVAFNYGENPASNWPFAATSPAQNADIAVIFEDPYNDYVNYGGSGAAWSPAAWESAYGPQHFSVLVYGAVGPGQPGGVCTSAHLQDVGYSYITPDSGWTTLAPAGYLGGELANC